MHDTDMSSLQSASAYDHHAAAAHHAGAIAVAGVAASAPIAAAAAADGASHKPKRRKEYTIQKNREAWTDEEHASFEAALRAEGRNWKRISQLIPTKSVIQIRSHAQKHFLKLDKAGQHSEIPPARAKKRAQHPYPKSRSGPNKTSSYSWNKANEEEQSRLQQPAYPTPQPMLTQAQLHEMARAFPPMIPILPPMAQTATPGRSYIPHSPVPTEKPMQAFPLSSGKVDMHALLPLTSPMDAADPNSKLHDHLAVPFATAAELDETVEIDDQHQHQHLLPHDGDGDGETMPVSLLTVLSSISSLLPPASPLEKSQARQRAIAREAARKGAPGKVIQFSLGSFPIASPSALPPTPMASHASFSHTPASTFYPPFSQTPFLSPSQARPAADMHSPLSSSGGNFSSPSFLLAASAKKKDEEADADAAQAAKQLSVPGRLNFDEAVDAELASKNVAVDGVKRKSSTSELDVDLDREIWERSQGTHVTESASGDSGAHDDSSNSITVDDSKRSSSLTSDVSSSTLSSHTTSAERDRKRRSNGSVHAFPTVDVDDREQKRARRNSESTPHSGFRPSVGGDSPFTWLADGESQSQGVSGTTSAPTYQMFDSDRVDATSTPHAHDTDMHVVSESDTGAEWSATSSSFSLASNHHSPVLEPTSQRRSSRHGHARTHQSVAHFEELPPTFSPLPFAQDAPESHGHVHPHAHGHAAAKHLSSTRELPPLGTPQPTSFFSGAPLTPGPIGLNAILASPFGLSAPREPPTQHLFSPQPQLAPMHAFATPFYDAHTPDKQQRAQGDATRRPYSPVPAPFFQHSPSQP